MSTSARLILTLTLVVGAIMAAAGYILVRRQEAGLMAQRRSEVLAHAITLQLALDNEYRAGRTDDAKALIDRLSENPKIEGVLLYDERGAVTARSDQLAAVGVGPSEEVAHVLATGESLDRVRQIDDRDYFSLVMPLGLGGGRRAAFELIEVTTFVKADIRRARLVVAATTLMLFVTIFAVVVFVTRSALSRPIASLLAGARALGGGDLGHRVEVPRGSPEFAGLAREFNRMADRLDNQRREASRAADRRLMLERDMRHHERLALVGRLAAGVAHEMGAPLNVIDGRAEQLLSRPDAPLERRQRNLTIIRAQARRITRTVQQLLGLARPYDLRLARVDLARIAASAADLVETQASAAGVSVVCTPGAPVDVDADAELLEQVLVNLCLNAVQATPPEGRVFIEPREEAGEATVRVRDSGPGIADAHMRHLFEPFFTTKEVGQGTGLGLSVSRRIVEEHGGRIEATNDPHGGAIFTVTLALAAAPPPGAQEEELDHAGAPPRR